MTWLDIGQIDFGTVDARHAATHGDFNEDLFSKVFIDPFGVDKADFYKGNKTFVFGIKGSGKSALLKFMEIEQKRKKSLTRFLYFSDTIREYAQQESNLGISADEVGAAQDSTTYWQAMILMVIAKIIFEAKIGTHKEFLEYIRRSNSDAPANFWSKIMKSAPTLESWYSELGPSQNIKIEGKFEQTANIEQFFSSAIYLLGKKKLPKPIFIFVDEMEVIFDNENKFKRDIEMGASLVRSIRDLNEMFRSQNIPIFICCAIRKEISERILGGDVAKIVSDLGTEVAWTETAKAHDEDTDYVHPLLEIVLRRLFYANRPGSRFMTNIQKNEILEQYLPFVKLRSVRGTSITQAQLLRNTTYRPRDMSILFNEAKRIDKSEKSFRFDTFTRRMFKPVRAAMWTDFSEALRSEFTSDQVEIFKKVFFRLPRRFQMQDFFNTLDDFSADPDIGVLLDSYSKSDWAKILRELYVLGAIGNIEKGEKIDERKLFHFRGYTDGLLIAKSVDIIKNEAFFDA